MENTMLNTSQHTSGATSQFKFELLKQITNNFSEDREIGRGAYGVVYKGVMDNGQDIAVKKLIPMTQDDDSEKQFHNECTNLMRVKHPNIVRLVGYCYETYHECIKHDGKYVFGQKNERALCFEYLDGGSLDKYVCDEPCKLEWDMCYKIIRGVCEGLNYLHNGYEDSIFHLDLKPANILLDNSMTPKIGDFGLSRLVSSTETCKTTTPLGTRGYTPPEYISKQEISKKFDVFSLGVLIIHIMAGRKHYYDHVDTPSKIIELVSKNWEKRLHAMIWSHASQEVKTCIEIALRCVKSDRHERPTISKIVDDLSNIDIAKLPLIYKATNLQSSEALDYRQYMTSGDVLHDDARRLTPSHYLPLLLAQTLAERRTMAEVVTGAMGTLLPKLACLLMEQYNLERAVRGEIMFLKAEMESMETALIKISQAPIDQPPDIQVKLWAKAARELSYDLEDCIDKFMLSIETHVRPEKPNNFKGMICHEIDDIKDIKIRIKELSERRDRYKIDSVPAKPNGPAIDTLRMSALYKKATELVGIDEKSGEVAKMLKESDEVSKKHLKVVSIIGLGGSGKTTLANAVYEELKKQVDNQEDQPPPQKKEEDQLQFHCTAFVTVSLNPNMEKIFKSLLRQLDKRKYQNINEATWGETQLISEIREFLANKRYLIVIDDIWDKYVWENIKYALIENKHGSRVITTTRILDVAQQAGSVYRLKPLSDVDSRRLFYQRIYEIYNKSPPSQLVEVSEDIIRKCGGVPLAIITIGSLLSSKKGRAHTYEYWSKVYKSMGSGLDNSNDDVKNMRRILSVSYSDLPPHLKTCLLHLSLYPEDYEIETEQLIWKWVGEGFIQKEHGRSLYEVGQDYLDELINKSLVQPVRFDIVNNVCSCRVHDMVHDLITSLSNEENFLTTVRSQQPLYLPSKIRRLSIQTSTEEVANQLPTVSLSHLRSITVARPAFCLLPALLAFPVLRVLDLTDCRQVNNNHWKDICKLFHLRYLSLKGTSISKIPKEIGNLQFLQVLDIRSTKIEEELPSTFIQLTQLLFVHMISIAGAVPRWMCSLSNLFSLSITLRTLGEEDLRVLGSLQSLSELHIQVKKPTRGRDKRLVIDSGCPFPCLTRFSLKSYMVELRFELGGMQSLRTMQLVFDDVRDTLRQFGDFVLGLENLCSLEHIDVNFKGPEIYKAMEIYVNAVEEEIDMNPNNPKLHFSQKFTQRDGLQRTSPSTGGCIVVGVIPYRVGRGDELEVLVISSWKRYDMIFPKGGWLIDESMDDAARRVALLEAGVRGVTGRRGVLGYWHYYNLSCDQTDEGYMFPLNVTDELDRWPKMEYRKRTWATVQQVMERCEHSWMREALKVLVARHAKQFDENDS